MVAPCHSPDEQHARGAPPPDRPYRRLPKSALQYQIDQALDDMDRSQRRRDLAKFRAAEARFNALHDEWDRRDGVANPEPSIATEEEFYGPRSIVGDEWIGYGR